jgi:hypothetical protein
MKKHKNKPDPIPAGRRAWHPNRGTRVMLGELKPGWVWLADGETVLPARKLRKPRVRARPIKD